MEEKNIKRKGFVNVFDQQIYIDLDTGKGFEKVIKKMSSYIEWYVSKIKLHCFDKVDLRQQFNLIALEGIKNFKFESNVKLSTFLFIHIKNRILTRLEQEKRLSKNASFLTIQYNYTCNECLHTTQVDKDNIKDIVCSRCENQFNNNWTIHPHINLPISSDELQENMFSNEDGTINLPKAYRNNIMYKENYDNNFYGQLYHFDNIDKKLDFIKIYEKQEDTVKKLIDLIYFEDYNLTDAAKKIGLTPWAASLKLQKLSKDNDIREYFIDNFLF